MVPTGTISGVSKATEKGVLGVIEASSVKQGRLIIVSRNLNLLIGITF